MKTPAATLTLLVIATAACGDADRPPSNPWLGSGGASPGALASAGSANPVTTPAPTTDPTRPATTSGVDRLAGTAGEVRGFESSSPTVAMYNGGRGFRLTATDDAGRYTLMAQLDFSTPITDATWPPGTTRTIAVSGRAAPDAPLRAIACSGPASRSYTFDQSASEVTVQVAQGATAETRVISFRQTFSDAPASVSGTFEYVPR